MSISPESPGSSPQDYFSRSPNSSDDESHARTSLFKKIDKGFQSRLSGLGPRRGAKIGKALKSNVTPRKVDGHLVELMKSEISSTKRAKFISAELPKALSVSKDFITDFTFWEVNDENFLEYMQVATGLSEGEKPLRVARAVLLQFPSQSEVLIKKFSLSPEEKKCLARECIFLGLQELGFQLGMEVNNDENKLLIELAILVFYRKTFNALQDRSINLSEIRTIIKETLTQLSQFDLKSHSEKFAEILSTYSEPSAMKFLKEAHLSKESLLELITYELSQFNTVITFDPERLIEHIKSRRTEELELVLNTDKSTLKTIAFAHNLTEESLTQLIRDELINRPDKTPDFNLSIKEQNLMDQ